MADAIERYKPQADWSTEEIIQNRRHGIVPETDEYRQAVQKALLGAGLSTDEDDAAADANLGDESRTVDHWLKRRQARL